MEISYLDFNARSIDGQYVTEIIDRTYDFK